jgi:hypothetical protein
MKKIIIIVAFLVVSVTSAVALATSSETIAKVFNLDTKSKIEEQVRTKSIDFSNSTETQSSAIKINNLNNQTPDYVFFEMLFNRVKALDEAADKLESQGRSGKIWREYLQQRAGLNNQQASKLRQAADEFFRAVEPTHRQAMQIINQARANATSGQRPAPLPPQLLTLQQQRQTLALTHGVRLQTALGAEILERLRQLFTQNSSGAAQPLTSADDQFFQGELNQKESNNE